MEGLHGTHKGGFGRKGGPMQNAKGSQNYFLTGKNRQTHHGINYNVMKDALISKLRTNSDSGMHFYSQKIKYWSRLCQTNFGDVVYLIT